MYFYKYNFENDEYEYISKSIRNILGYSREEVLKWKMEDIKHGIFAEDWLKIIELADEFALKSSQKRQNYSKDYRLRDAKNNLLWIRDSLSVTVNGRSQVASISGIAKDVTELKEKQAELKISNDKYNLLSSLIDGFFEANILTNSIYVNENIRKVIHNIDKEPNFNYSTFIKAVHDEDLEETLLNLGEHIDKNNKFSFKLRIKQKNGFYRWYICKGKATQFDEIGEITAYAGVLTDVNKLKKIEQTLKENEIKLRRFIDNSYHGIILTDKKGKITEWNRGMFSITGLKKNKVMQKYIWDVLHSLRSLPFRESGNLEHFKIEVNEFLRTGEAPWSEKKDEEIFIRPDGTERIAETFIFPIKEDESYAAAMLVRDITGLKMMEEELVNNEEFYRELVENSKEVHYKQNILNGRFEYVSPHIFEITGFTPFEFRQLDSNGYIERVHPEDRDKFIANNNKYFGNNLLVSSTEIEYRFKDKSGGYKYFSDHHKVIYNDNGDPNHIIGSIRDISDTKRFERALMESTNKYRLLVENQNELIIKLNLRGQFDYANPAFTDMFDKNENELLGKKFMELVHEDDRTNTSLSMEDLYRKPNICYLEHRMKTKFGFRWIAWSKRALNDQDGSITQFIGVGRDITKRKKIEEALKQSEKNYREVFEGLNQAVMIFKPDNEMILNANNKTLEMFGYEKSEFVGMHLTQISVNVDRGKRHILKLMKKKKDYSLKTSFYRPNGTILTVKANTSLIDFNGEKAILALMDEID